MRDLTAMQAAADKAIERFGGIDIVMANAGHRHLGSVLQVDPRGVQDADRRQRGRGVQHGASHAALGDRAARLRADRVVAGGIRRRARAGALRRVEGRRSNTSPTRCGWRSPTAASTSARRTCRGSTRRWCRRPRRICRPSARCSRKLPGPLNKTTSVEKCGEAFVKGIEGRKRADQLPGLGGRAALAQAAVVHPARRTGHVASRARAAAADGRRGRRTGPLRERPHRSAGEAVTCRIAVRCRR